MISCDRVHELLSELLDGELPLELRMDVEQHLETCRACHDEFERWKKLNDRLSESLAIVGVDAKVAQIENLIKTRQPLDSSRVELRVDGNTVELEARRADDVLRPRRGPVVGPGNSQVVFRVAIAVSLAFALFWIFRDPGETRSAIAARMVVATGPVQLKSLENNVWRTIASTDSVELSHGTHVRTIDDSLCELRTANQGKVRMNRDCEVIVNTPEQLELIQGKLWCSAPEDGKLEVIVPLKEALATLRCPSSVALECEATPSYASCTSPGEGPMAGQAEVQLGNETWRVESGKTLVIEDSQTVSQRPSEPVNDTWQLPLLALSDETRGELRDSMRKLLAPIGRTKARHLNESQIRALGPAGALPLLAFIADEDSAAQRDLRRIAMFLAEETADETAIPWLRKLTSDDDDVIATRAAQLLAKLSKN